MPSTEGDGNTGLGITLGEFDNLPSDKRVAFLESRDDIAGACVQAIVRAHSEGLSKQVLVDPADVIYTLAEIIPRLASKPPGGRKWDTTTQLSSVWAEYRGRDGDEKAPFRLPWLVWSLVFEMNPAWRRPDSQLTSETAKTTWDSNAKAWFDTDEELETSNDLWKRHWSPNAKARFKGIVHPRNYIRSQAKRRLVPARSGRREQSNHDDLDRSGQSLEARIQRSSESVDERDPFDLRPGELGELLREIGLDNLLLDVCQQLAEKSPVRYLYFWLYHAVGFSPIELTKKQGYASRVRDEFPKFLNASEASVSKQFRVGRDEFQRALRKALLERFSAVSEDDERDDEQVSAIQELIGRLREADADDAVGSENGEVE